MVDCSHGNSSKDFRKQPIVAESIAHQLSATESGRHISGVMVESNLVEGNQSIPADGDLSKLVYGKSVTDACVNWDDTVKILDALREGCEGAGDFEAKFKTLIVKLDVVEHEETWQQIDNALKNLTSLVKAGATKLDTFSTQMKQVSKYLNSAIISERTRLSGTALELVEEMARQMETRFQPVGDMVFATVLKTCARANKVFVTRGVKCLTTVITYAHASEQTPRVCLAATTDANKTMRASATKLLMSLVSCCTVPELAPHMVAVEKAIALGVVDANPDARTTSRQTYEIYIKRFATRVDQFHAGLSATARKYLKIADKTAAGQPTKAGGARPVSRFAAYRQRLPLSDRTGPTAKQEPAAAAVAAATEAAAPSDAPSGPQQRLKPVRPMRRDVKATPIPVKPTTSVVVAASAVPPVPLKLNDDAQQKVQPPALAGTKTDSLENVLLSPHSGKSTLAKLFGEDQSTPEQRSAANSDSEVKKTPIDSAHASAAASESGASTRAPSPSPNSGEDKDTALASSLSGDESAAASAAAEDEKPKDKDKAKRPVARAARGKGLSFTSLSSSAHAQRPQSRATVVSRVEEALRARPPRPAAAVEARRMTLRSDSRAAPAADSKGPGYLRATAASSKRLAETATATRGGSKRRRQDDPASADTDATAAKTAKYSANGGSDSGARRRSTRTKDN
ncbi:hypothetical protein EV175_003546 [Coemansia sp. RSA 1933]|nr:hypothetical protein EV175_003546 [Coemansia sp. RSA 1933]